MPTPPSPPAGPFAVPRRGFALAAEATGDGPPILLLHGLTATRRYVVHGSRALERGGRRVVGYDSRGHGESDAPPDGDYGYDALIDDALAVLDAAGVDRAVLMGQSMGAATAAGLALRAPERVAALVAVTPAHLGRPSRDLDRWDRLSEGLRTGGVDGFMAAYGRPRVPERQVEAVTTVIRQRLSRHLHPDAVADALARTPRSAAFAGVEALRAVAAPTLVVASRDEMDPEHPFAIARTWAEEIPGARMVVEAEGESPLAWRGGSLSQAVGTFLDG